jgi:hypothetical protein
MKIKLYICCHKPCDVPKGDIIIPIHAGKAITKQDLGFIGDDRQDNISNKNLYYCELSAIYWVWKNIKAEVVGFFQYRRFLNLKSLDTKFYNITPSFTPDYGITQKKVS